MELSLEQARAFVGPRADYYVSRWARVGPAASRAIGFNLAAFFFSLAWLLYRRMYLWFWIALALLIVSVFVEELMLAIIGLQEAPFLTMLINIGVAAAFGTFGTYWYYLHARRTVRRLTVAGQAEIPAVAHAGGTNWWAPSLFALAFIGLAVLALWADNQGSVAP